jgi:hypothetical protein
LPSFTTVPAATTAPSNTPLPSFTSVPYVTDSGVPQIKPQTEIISTTPPNNTTNSVPTTPVGQSAPPPGLNTPSIGAMNTLGLYSTSSQPISNGSGNITQLGGEGPNNYFQPNIFIKRKPQQTNPPSTSNNIDQYSSYSMMYDSYVPQYYVDTQYGNESGYNMASGINQTQLRDPIDTARVNALNYQQQLSNSKYYGSDTCVSCGSVPTSTPSTESFGDNTFVHNCKMKEFIPGYQVQAPKCWDVPQKRPPVCLGNNERLPSAVFDRGTPLNALNLDTSVGSIMPKFTYTEQPRS